MAEIEDDDNKKLFMSLVGVGRVFFNYAVEKTRSSAFSLGHKLLEKACSSGNDYSIAQCMKVFYCWLNAHSFLGNPKLQEKIDLETDLKIDLDNLNNICNYSSFPEI